MKQLSTKRKAALGLLIVIGLAAIYWFLVILEVAPAPAFLSGKKKYFPLKMGSKNKYVGELQAWINQNLMPPLVAIKVDDVFGIQTQTALINIIGKSELTYEDYKKMQKGKLEKPTNWQ